MTGTNLHGPVIGTWERHSMQRREIPSAFLQRLGDPGKTDVVLLEMQLSRFAQRRDYWKIRAAEMQGGRSRGPD